MPHCKCLVLIPNPIGGSHDYAVVAKTSREAVRKAMEAHPYPVPIDAVITVIADGRGPSYAGSAEHNARQPTFWHRAGTVPAASGVTGNTEQSEIRRRKNLLN